MDKEQADRIKTHLLQQLVNFPEDKRELIKEKIESMTEEQLEEFLKQNELDYEKQEETPQCLFCLIVEKKIKSYIIEEEKDNLAILEINPISKGHILIVPKKHDKKESISKDSFILAEKIKNKLIKKFNPSEVLIETKEILGHGIVEVIPLYGNETERKKLSEEELTNLQKEILSEEKQQKIENKEEKQEIIKLKPRIP